jgi:hypothetical protein
MNKLVAKVKAVFGFQDSSQVVPPKFTIQEKLASHYYYQPTKAPIPTAKRGTAQHRRQVKAYRASLADLQAEFKADLFAHYNITNPRAHQVYEEVLSNSCELKEVYYFFGKLVELLNSLPT